MKLMKRFWRWLLKHPEVQDALIDAGVEELRKVPTKEEDPCSSD